MKRTRIATLLTLISVGLLCTACGSTDRPAPDPEPTDAGSPTVAVDVPPEALAEAKAAATALGGELVKTLMGELSDGGTVQAVRVCSEIAPSIAEKHSNSGTDVGRVSLKLRNPANAPDAYEERKLSELESLRAQGQMPEEIAEVVDENGRRTLRYLRPISVMPPCLKCHGDRAELDPQVVELLEERYPDDQATGYAVGDLRGAISVSVEL